MWSVGVIMYFMLVGRLPWKEKEKNSKLLQAEIVKGDFALGPLKQHQFAMDLIKKLLALNPIDRITTK